LNTELAASLAVGVTLVVVPLITVPKHKHFDTNTCAFAARGGARLATTDAVVVSEMTIQQ
jgi:hypothetical protein